MTEEKTYQNDKFTKGCHGLSKDMEEFIWEQAENYIINHAEFKSSFYNKCIDILLKGYDLTNNQLIIIEKDYNIVKEERIKLCVQQ